VRRFRCERTAKAIEDAISRQYTYHLERDLRGREGEDQLGFNEIAIYVWRATRRVIWSFIFYYLF
jgi:hypothetical protein